MRHFTRGELCECHVTKTEQVSDQLVNLALCGDDDIAEDGSSLADVLYDLARCHVDLEEFDEAVPFLEQLAVVSPKHRSGLLLLADIQRVILRRADLSLKTLAPLIPPPLPPAPVPVDSDGDTLADPSSTEQQWLVTTDEDSRTWFSFALSCAARCEGAKYRGAFKRGLTCLRREVGADPSGRSSRLLLRQVLATHAQRLALDEMNLVSALEALNEYEILTRSVPAADDPDREDPICVLAVAVVRFIGLEIGWTEFGEIANSIRAVNPVLVSVAEMNLLEEADRSSDAFSASETLVGLLTARDESLSYKSGMSLGERLRTVVRLDDESCWWYLGEGLLEANLLVPDLLTSVWEAKGSCLGLNAMITEDERNEAKRTFVSLISLQPCQPLADTLGFLLEQLVSYFGTSERSPRLHRLEFERILVAIGKFLQRCHVFGLVWSNAELHEGLISYSEWLMSECVSSVAVSFATILFSTHMRGEQGRLRAVQASELVVSGRWFTNVPYWSLVGTMHSHQEQHQKSVDALRRVKEVAAPGSAAMTTYINSLCQVGEFAEALPLVEKVVGTDVVSCGHAAALAMGCLFGLGNVEEGQAYARRAIDQLKDSSDPTRFQIISSCYLTLLDSENAVRVCDEGLEVFPNCTDLLLLKSHVFGVTGRLNERVEVLLELVKGEVKNLEACMQACEAVLLLGSYETLVELAHSCVKSFRGQKAVGWFKALEFYGVAHLRNDDYGNDTRIGWLEKSGPPAFEKREVWDVLYELAFAEVFRQSADYRAALKRANDAKLLLVQVQNEQPPTWVLSLTLRANAKAHADLVRNQRPPTKESYESFRMASALYEQCVQMDPSLVQPRLELASLMELGNMHERALHVLSSAIELCRQQGDPNVLLHGLASRMSVHVALGKFSECMVDFDEIMKLNIPASSHLSLLTRMNAFTAWRSLDLPERFEEMVGLMESCLSESSEPIDRAMALQNLSWAKVVKGRLNEGLDDMLLSFDHLKPTSSKDSRFQLLKTDFRTSLRDELDRRALEMHVRRKELVRSLIEEQRDIFSVEFPTADPVHMPRLFALRCPKFANEISSGNAKMELHDDFAEPIGLLCDWLLGNEIPESLTDVNPLITAYHASNILGARKAAIAFLYHICKGNADNPDPVISLYVQKRQVFFVGFEHAQSVVLSFLAPHAARIEAACQRLDPTDPDFAKYTQLLQDLTVASLLPKVPEMSALTSLHLDLAALFRTAVRPGTDVTRDFLLRSSDGAEIQVHRSIVMVSSTYCRELIESAPEDDPDTVIELDCGLDTLWKVAEYLYCHRRTRFKFDEMTEDDWQELLRVLTKYQLVDFLALVKHAFLTSHHVLIVKAEKQASTYVPPVATSAQIAQDPSVVHGAALRAPEVQEM